VVSHHPLQELDKLARLGSVQNISEARKLI